MKARGLLFALCTAIFGCGPTVNSVCEKLEKNCDVSVSANCENDGASTESKAETAGCSDQFDDYLDCTNDQGCNWKTECAAQVKALEACGVTLVPQ